MKKVASALGVTISEAYELLAYCTARRNAASRREMALGTRWLIFQDLRGQVTLRFLLAVLPGLACDSPGPNEGAGDCRTLRHKTHSTRTGDELTVVYAWHPWAGRLVYIHDVVDRAIGASARCSLIGVPDARVQELPIWMLEAAACRSVRLTCEPIVPLAAFAALQRLLLATVRPVTMEESSDARIASPERHRGDRHAKSKTTSSPPSSGPPIRARIGGRSTGGNSTSVEHAARPDTADRDRPDHPAADRARQRQGRRGARLRGVPQR